MSLVAVSSQSASLKFVRCWAAELPSQLLFPSARWSSKSTTSRNLSLSEIWIEQTSPRKHILAHLNPLGTSRHRRAQSFPLSGLISPMSLEVSLSTCERLTSFSYWKLPARHLQKSSSLGGKHNGHKLKWIFHSQTSISNSPIKKYGKIVMMYPLWCIHFKKRSHCPFKLSGSHVPASGPRCWGWPNHLRQPQIWKISQQKWNGNLPNLMVFHGVSMFFMRGFDWTSGTPEHPMVN